MMRTVRGAERLVAISGQLWPQTQLATVAA